MSQWIIDASFTLGWFFDDENSKYHSEQIDAFEEKEAIVPFIWTYEVSNGLVTAFHRKRISLDQVNEFTKRLLQLPITVDQLEPFQVFEITKLSIQHQLTTYDAAYLELALRLKLPVATRDKELQNALLACGIELVHF